MMNWNAAKTQQIPAPRPHPRPYVVQHDFDGPRKLSTTVVHALSEATNADVTDVEETLCHQVDPQALDHLFRPVADESPRAVGQLSLRIWGTDVTIYASGQVVIDPSPPQ